MQTKGYGLMVNFLAISGKNQVWNDAGTEFYLKNFFLNKTRIR